MSPEHAVGRNCDLSPVCDDCALGAVFDETVTGRPPFFAESPQAVIKQVKTKAPVLPRQLNASATVAAFSLGAAAGTISPGVNGPGSIRFNSGLHLGEAMVVAIDALNTTPRTGYDQLEVVGTVGITNSVLQFTASGSIPVGSKLIVVTNDSTDAITGTFSGRAEGALFDSNLQLFRIRYAEGSGNDVAIVRDDGGVRLTGIGINLEGQFEIRGLGTNGAIYSIYASPAVPSASWELIGTSTADPGGTFFLTDPNAFQFPRRFYYSIGP